MKDSWGLFCALLLLFQSSALSASSKCTQILAAISLQGGKGNLQNLAAFIEDQIQQGQNRLETPLIVETALGWALRTREITNPEFQTRIGSLLDKIPGALEVLSQKMEGVSTLGAYGLTPKPEGLEIKGKWPITVRQHFAYQQVTVHLRNGKSVKGRLQPAGGTLPIFKDAQEMAAFTEKFAVRTDDDELRIINISEVSDVVSEGTLLFDAKD